MRVGLVGIYTNYRPQEVKSVKYGEVDLIFEGDLHFPTESRTIKVLNSELCRFLIQTLADFRKEGKLPILTLVCWLDLTGKEPGFTLLQVLSVNERRAA